MCADEDVNNDISSATPSISMSTVEEMIPETECNILWDYTKHGTDWMCKCVTGNRQSPIDLPDRDKVYQYYTELTKTILDSVPEAVQCMKEHCSKDWYTLVKIINRFSKYEKDSVTFKYYGSYVPITRSNFLMNQ